mgnify:CR=1 FL=1
MKIKVLITTLLLAAATAAKADSLSTHGMFIFGDKVTYASHLPMFHGPHNYQLILKVGCAGVAISKAVESYKALKFEGHSVFTIAPELMDLTDVMSGLKTQFSAKLYQGHFEKGGKELGSVVVNVQKIVLSTTLNPNSQEQNKYFVFGEGDEYFGVHLIQGKPSYDTIVKLSKPYSLESYPCRTRRCEESTKIPVSDEKLPMILTKSIVDGNVAPMTGDQIGIFDSVLTDVLNVLYFEQGELSH